MVDSVVEVDYDLCVVGAGMIGSAAARHASLIPGQRICVIGPQEPTKMESEDGRDIFGAHYDEGRITRRTDPDPVWAILAQKSISQYKHIEKQSGLNFYEEVGCLMAGSKGENFVESVKKNAVSQNVDVDYLDSEKLKSTFPYLNFASNDCGIYETEQAGYVSPRKLVEAQLKIAEQNGCDVIRDVVKKVQRETNRSNDYVMRVRTEKGHTFLAKKVLLATGAFTSFRDLFNNGLEPEVDLAPLTVALVEIRKEKAREIRSMPSVIYFGRGGSGWPDQFPRETSGNAGFYMLPPVLYPNGKYYLKLGHFHSAISHRLTTVDEVKRWFCSKGNEPLAKATAHLINSIVKDLDAPSYHSDSCVIVETPTNRPYVDMIHGQLGVALGGNGYAAKSSDEIGRIAANLVIKNTWDSNIPREFLKLRFKSCLSKM